MTPRDCIVCGVRFERLHPSSITCSMECRHARKAEIKKSLGAAYSAANRDAFRGYQRKYYEKNREKCIAATMRSRRKNPLMGKAAQQRLEQKVTAAGSAYRELEGKAKKTPASRLERLRRQRAENPEKYRAAQRAKYQRNRKRVREQQHAMRQRRKAIYQAFKELNLI